MCSRPKHLQTYPARYFRFWLALALSATVLLALSSSPRVVRPVQAVSSGIVISQVYGGGGNASAPYLNDYVELFNRGTTTVSLTGWSVQYASATGTGTFAANPIATLSGSIP